MEVLNSIKTKLGNTIELIGEPSENNILIVGVVHGDEPQGKYLIDKYIEKYQKSTLSCIQNPTSESEIPVLPQGEDIKLVQLAKNLRNNMTKEEIILWQHIKNRQIENIKFRRQQQIGRYICDFVSFEKRIVIEIDGGQHNQNSKISKDEIRDKYLTSVGYKVLRFWNNEINNNLENVLLKIRNIILECPPLAGGPEFLIPSRGNDKRGGKSLLFIPCLNPDGMQLNTRTNANNVDINRNFPTQNWGQNKGDNATCDDETSNYFGGKSPASEIETQFLIDTIEKYTPNLIITLHTPYKIVNYDGPAKETARMISDIIKYPVEESVGYPTPGSFGTWAGVERNIATITLEMDEEIPVTELLEPVHQIFDKLKF